MKIVSLYIREFGAIRDMTLDLHPLLQVIEGENESGKSTVAAFIRYMLYGFSAKGEAAANERKHRMTADHHRASGSMTLLHGDKEYRIERTTTALLQNGHETFRETAELFDTKSGLAVRLSCPIGDYLLGVPEHVYTATAFISGVSDMPVNGTDMKDAVEQILFSGSSRINVQQALTKLDAARRALLHKNGKGGDIFELEKRADDLQSALSASHDASRKAAAIEADLTRTHEERADIKEDRTKLEELDTAYQNLSLIREYDALHGRENELERSTAQYDEHRKKNTHDGFFPDKDYLADLSVNRRLVSDAAKLYADAQRRALGLAEQATVSPQSKAYIDKANEAGGFEKIRQNAAFLSHRVTRNYVASSVLLLFTALFFFIALTAPALNIALAVTAWFLSAASFAAATVLFVSARHGANALLILCREYGTNTKNSLLERLLELETELNSKADFDSRLRAAEETANDYLARCEKTVGDLNVIAARWGRHIDPAAVTQSLDELEAEATACIEESDRLFSHRQTVKQDVALRRAKLEKYNEVTVRTLVSPAKRKNLQTLEEEGRIGEISRGIALCDEKISALDTRIHELELARERESAHIGTPDILSAKLTELQLRIQTLRARHRAYLTAGEVISGAGTTLRNRIAPKLTEYARRLMSEMTSGTHDTLSVTANLGLTVTDEEGTHDILRLSGATTDDAYIALRLALTSLLFREAPPVCYDESFVHQDAARLSALLNALSVIGKEDDRQQIIFTCHGREKEALTRLGIDHGHLMLPPHSL